MTVLPQADHTPIQVRPEKFHDNNTLQMGVYSGERELGFNAQFLRGGFDFSL